MVDREETTVCKYTIMVLITICVLIIIPLAVNADMGRIVTSGAAVREDFQKAVIIHNFEEEILILGTDLESDQNTIILRFIPFPAEPKIASVKGDPFQRVLEIISKHQLLFGYYSKTMGMESAAANIEVLLSARSGAHDITLIKINEFSGFKNWVEAFLASKRLVRGKGNTRVEEVVVNYIKRNIRYFVFDIVEVTPELKTISPIAYRFKSDKLYYPLITSNTFGGSGGIDLIIVAPGTVCDPLNGKPLYNMEKEIYKLHPRLGPLGDKNSLAVEVSSSAEISKEELTSIYPAAGELFSDESSFIQIIRYYGEYDFDNDILVDISGIPQEAYEISEPDGDSILLIQEEIDELPKSD